VIFGSFGKASEASSKLMIKFGTGKFESELGSNILGNIVPAVGSVIEKNGR